MTGLLFKKTNDSISKCSSPGLVSLIFLLEFTDLLTAYLNFLVKPRFFLENELNHYIKAAFYYGQWDRLFLPWITLISSIILFFFIFKCLKKENFFNFAMTSIIILFIGASLTNVCGIIFDSAWQGRLFFILAETLFLILLAQAVLEQIEQISEKEKREFLNRIRTFFPKKRNASGGI